MTKQVESEEKYQEIKKETSLILEMNQKDNEKRVMI